MLINNKSPIYSVQHTHSVSSPEALKNTEPAQSLDSTVSISDLARHIQAVEKAEDAQLAAYNIEKDAKLKMQYQDNLATFIANAQRYSQQDVVVPMIENRAAITAYSLVENKVIASSPSNELEE